MESKKWYESRTLWIAVVAGVIGIFAAVGVEIPEWVFAFLTATGLYTARTSTTKVQ